MVDMDAYRLMHGDSEDREDGSDDQTARSELGDDILEQDEPPDDSFALMLPATLNGYGFHHKKWSE